VWISSRTSGAAGITPAAVRTGRRIGATTGRATTSRIMSDESSIFFFPPDKVLLLQQSAATQQDLGLEANSF
jgi:hypothetical protein